MDEYTPLSSDAIDEGALLLDLVRDGWGSWVNRRVESIELEDDKSVLRKVSVDFTIPAPDVGEDQPQDAFPRIPYVPVALLRKRALRRFDLRDRNGNALPLLTADQNAKVGASMLTAMTLAYGRQVGGRFAQSMRGASGSVLPAEVGEDLRLIPRLDIDAAVKRWQALGQVRGTHPQERAWRMAIVGNHELMALAHDLAQNFLLLVPLTVTPGERRIVKYAYAEPSHAPSLAPLRAARGAFAKRAALAVATYNFERRRRELAVTTGMGYLFVRVGTVAVEEGDKGRPIRDITVGVKSSAPRLSKEMLSKEMLTDARGRVVEALPAGDYDIEIQAPLGMAPVGPIVQKVRVDPGPPPREPLRFVLRAVSSVREETKGSFWRTGRALVLRSLGLSKHRLTLTLPAVGHSRTYHVDVEAPEGLRFVGTRLEARRSYPAHGAVRKAARGERPPATRDLLDGMAEERQSVQRTHLHVSRQPAEAYGVLTLKLMPLAVTIAIPALATSMLTTLLLVLVTARDEGIGPNGGSLATLLLFATGPVSAYASRPREHAITTKLARGLRGLTLVAGVAGLAGAVILLLGRDWEAPAGRFAAMPEQLPEELDRALWALVGVSATCAIIAAAAGLRAWWVVRRRT